MIKISGDLADQLGSMNLERLAAWVARRAQQAVVVEVEGPSDHHEGRRVESDGEDDETEHIARV